MGILDYIENFYGRTPFNFAFRIKAMILVEMGILSLHVDSFNKHNNLDQLRANLDFLDEV